MHIPSILKPLSCGFSFAPSSKKTGLGMLPVAQRGCIGKFQDSSVLEPDRIQRPAQPRQFFLSPGKKQDLRIIGFQVRQCNLESVNPYAPGQHSLKQPFHNPV